MRGQDQSERLARRRFLGLQFQPIGAGDVIESRLGDPKLDADGVAELRAVLEATGAVAEVEARITALTDDALAALASGPVDAEAAEVLSELAAAATARRD